MTPIKLIFAALLLSTFVLHGHAQTSPNNATKWESPESISNRWSSIPIEKTTKAAEGGDLSAQYYLGAAYEQGYGVEKDPVAAYKWIRPLAEKGMPAAQRKLGWMLEKGQGVAPNRAEAIEWDRKAAEQGDMLAQINLALTYASGDLKDRDYPTAEKWMRKAAEHGNARGQYAFGHLLVNEFNVNGTQVANFPEAAEWLQKAAEQGYVRAELELADLYEYGKLGDDKHTNCIPWYLKAAAQGDSKAKSKIAELQQQYPDNELLKTVDAVGTLRESAANGNLDAQMQLSERYSIGEGVAKDPVQAFQWMQKAAGAESSKVTKLGEARYRLAMMYEKGKGVAPDLAQAIHYYQAAADTERMNKPDPFFKLGQFYENGTGVPQDDRKAAEYYFTAGTEFGPSYIETVRVFSGQDKQPHVEVVTFTTGESAVESLLNLYVQGRGLPDSSALDQRLSQLEQIKEQTAKGMYLLGELCYQGKLVPKDMAKAAERFNKAATAGSPDAMNRLGEMWAAGVNGAPDQKEAASWYRKAAKKGYALGQLNLGRAYQKGEGLEQNPVEASAWMQLAAEQKLPAANDELSALKAKLSTDQREAARQRVTQLTAEISPKPVK